MKKEIDAHLVDRSGGPLQVALSRPLEGQVQPEGRVFDPWPGLEIVEGPRQTKTNSTVAKVQIRGTFRPKLTQPFIHPLIRKLYLPRLS